MVTIALSHLQGRGVRLEPHEAVALARELIAHPCGIPAPDNIRLGSDGSATCVGRGGTPSVASVAALLAALLPPGTPSVPAPLRYTIARGLGDVEAPPFGSLDEFSTSLARFEQGASREVLRGVLQRAVQASRAGAASIAVTRTVEEPSSPTAPPLATPPPDVVPRRPSARRWMSWAAASVAASFVVGFVVVGGVAVRTPAVKTPARSTTTVPGPPATAPASAATATPTTRPGTRPTTTPAAPATRPVDAGPRVKAVEGIRATSGSAFSPAFASDGTAIFFHTGDARDTRSAIEVATGSEDSGDLGIMTIVDDGSRNYHAEPSPDGRLVAFDSDRGGVRGVYVANRDGTHVRRISGDGYAAVPTWSPDNQWLTYIRAEADTPSVWNLWIQPAAGGPARRLTHHRYGQTWAASWFPDGRRIAYSHEDALTVMDVRSGSTTRYRTPVKGALVRTPAVSPDGTRIIFQVFRHGGWMLDLADGSMQRVLTDPTAEEFAWAPDGRRIAFHSRRDGRWGIYVLSRGSAAPAVR